MHPGGRREKAFSMVELLISISLLGVVSYAAWDAYISGTKQGAAASESLSAAQGALVLMETIQEDLRQMSILNYRNQFGDLSQNPAPYNGQPFNPSLVPFSMYFSTNGKSFMFRKSTTMDTTKAMEGSSFSVVIYHLMRDAGLPPGVYKMNRLERSTDGNRIVDTGQEYAQRVLGALYLKDVRFDLVVRLDNSGAYAYETFVRVSVTATNLGNAQNSDRVYFVSNLFSVVAPEFISNRSGEVGFARRFPESRVQNPSNEILAGPGYLQELPPTTWNDAPDFAIFKDYLDADGQWKDVQVPAAATPPTNIWSGLSSGGLSSNYCYTAKEFLKLLVGERYHGRITGQVLSRAGVTPSWIEPFSIDVTTTAPQPVMPQISQILTNMIPRGYQAVEDLGHMLYAETQSGVSVISDNDAKAICNGQ